jgi:hypothetical protein
MIISFHCTCVWVAAEPAECDLLVETVDGSCGGKKHEMKMRFGSFRDDFHFPLILSCVSRFHGHQHSLGHRPTRKPRMLLQTLPRSLESFGTGRAGVGLREWVRVWVYGLVYGWGQMK